MSILRRDLIRTVPLAIAGAATLSALLRPAAAQSAPGRAAATAPRWDRTLVLVELKGGNDGLNTLVPFADPAYARLRPTLQIAAERVLRLDSRVGLHPALQPLMTAWQARELAIVQGVGYPYPNRSHFRSIEIWDTASASNQVIDEGWLSQAFRGHAPRPGTTLDAVVIDLNALPASGPGLRTVVMQDAENFIRQAERMGPSAGSPVGNPALRHVLEVERQLNAAALGMRDRLRTAAAPAEAYGEAPFERALELANRLLVSGLSLPVIKLALGGFDTHARQLEPHARLLEQLADGLALLRRNLIAAGRWSSTLVMTYSEFGRRAQQNGSSGTDHGTAAPHFLIGGVVRGGLHGAYPSLADLVDGDLRHSVDFRDLFATVARQWWGVSRDFGLRAPARLDLIA